MSFPAPWDAHRAFPPDVPSRLLELIGDARTHDGNAGRADGLDDTTLGVLARHSVWAHSSHLGDARATQMGAWGDLNLGQLARERHGDRVFLLGFTTQREP